MSAARLITLLAAAVLVAAAPPPEKINTADPKKPPSRPVVIPPPLPATAAVPPQPAALPTRAEIDAIVAELQGRLFTFQDNDHWVVWLKPGAKPVDGMAVNMPLRGTLVENARGNIRIKGEDGQVRTIPTDQVGVQMAPGHFWPEENNGHAVGGSTAMATYALVVSGLDPVEPRLKKALDSLVKSSTPMGTYPLSFRLNTLSHLVCWSRPQSGRAGAANDFKAVLEREAAPMWQAMDDFGLYGYTSFPSPGDSRPKQGDRPRRWGTDHSNTQCGVYGVWAAENASIEIPSAYWHTVDQHWRDSQGDDGGWGYLMPPPRVANPPAGAPKIPQTFLDSTPNMTDAGMNSLYLVMDKLWSRQVDKRGYVRLRGFTYDEQAQAGIKETLAAIARGWKWYEANPEEGRQRFQLYHEFGMQRLGIASGRKYIGGRSWFQHVVETTYATRAQGAQLQSRQGLQDAAWRLMCIAFGRAPILFNKLDHGDEADWNYYFRDVASITDWIGHQMEKRYNWQIVSLSNDIDDLQDAPILFISGYKKLDLTADQKALLKQYCDLGGTVFLHPNQNSDQFKLSAKALFAELYKTEGFEWQSAAKNHPIYNAHAAADAKIVQIPVKYMSDGGRDFAFMVEGDLAGAWQLRMAKTQADLHELMLNLRLIAAADYDDLTPRLRPKTALKPTTRSVAIARLKHNGQSQANSLMYEAMAPALSEVGLALDVRDQVAAGALADARVIHLTGHNKFELTADEQAALKQSLARGAFLVIDSAYGRDAFYQSAQGLVNQLGLECKSIDLKTHPLFEKVAPQMRPNRWMRDTVPAGRGFEELSLNGKVVGLISRVDLTATATGNFVYGAPAFNRPAVLQLWSNIIAAAVAAPALPDTRPSP